MCCKTKVAAWFAWKAYCLINELLICIYCKNPLLWAHFSNRPIVGQQKSDQTNNKVNCLIADRILAPCIALQVATWLSAPLWLMNSSLSWCRVFLLWWNCSQCSASSPMILPYCNVNQLLEQQRLGCWRGPFNEATGVEGSNGVSMLETKVHWTVTTLG